MANIVEIANEIIKQVDIVDIISRYISVIKKGRNYTAVCPFHDDTNPSMMISPDKQIFNCFVCHTGGNAILFVQKYEKISYYEAVKKVCELAGIHTYDDYFTSQSKHINKIDDSLLSLYNCANDLNKFYVYSLSTEEGKIALDYLHNREISDEQIQKFGFGYSLSDGTKTIAYLQAKKYSLKNIEDIGIAHARLGETKDSNAGRLIFPICDSNGKVIGFSARRLNEDKSQEKYRNSPETALFHKSTILYNLHNALNTAKHDGYIYVTEGFMDVLAFDSIGINSCVALMGTAFTKEVCSILRRLNVEVRLCLDGDLPGQMAMMKAMSMLDKNKINYRIVFKEGNTKDPDEILKQDGEDALKEFSNSLHDGFEFAVNYYLRNGGTNNLDDRKKILNYFLPYLVTIDDYFILNDYILKLSKVTDFDQSLIRDAVEKSKKNEGNADIIDLEDEAIFYSNKKTGKTKKVDLAERNILIQMLNYSEAVNYYNENIHFFYSELYRTIADYLTDLYEKTGDINISQVINELNASDSAIKDRAITEIINLTNEDMSIPTYSERFMDECSSVVKEEKKKEFSKMSLNQAIKGKSELEKAAIINEYLKNKKN